mmetsp:Transcript_65795/g.76490  ORF Transcript_65795/g.76490 Transcript_65795/m.76490 type:complete len:115 (+) Transcript_65795:17-361(+)
MFQYFFSQGTKSFMKNSSKFFLSSNKTTKSLYCPSSIKKVFGVLNYEKNMAKGDSVMKYTTFSAINSPMFLGELTMSEFLELLAKAESEKSVLARLSTGLSHIDRPRLLVKPCY